MNFPSYCSLDKEKSSAFVIGIISHNIFVAPKIWTLVQREHHFAVYPFGITHKLMVVPDNTSLLCYSQHLKYQVPLLHYQIQLTALKLWVKRYRSCWQGQHSLPVSYCP